MLQEIEAKRGISLQDIDKIDIIRGKLYLYDDGGARCWKSRSATSTARRSRAATSARISWVAPPISPSAASAAPTATPAS